MICGYFPLSGFYGPKIINLLSTLKDYPYSTLAALRNCTSTNILTKERPEAPKTCAKTLSMSDI